MLAFVETAIEALASAWTWMLRALVSAEFWVGAAAVAVLVALVVWRRRYRCCSVSIGLPFNLGSATYELTSQDRIIAWKMYVQLKTRKAALPFDEDQDLICDVYSSLYELFPIARELLSEMPLAEVARPRGVSDLIVRILNDAIRPHMTRWQAGFRYWWEGQVKADANNEKRPQDIQKAFPGYPELIDDLKRTNTELAKLAEDLLLFARPQRRSWMSLFPKRAAVPTPPTTVSATMPLSIEGTDRSTVVQPTHPYEAPTPTEVAGQTFTEEPAR